MVNAELELTVTCGAPAFVKDSPFDGRTAAVVGVPPGGDCYAFLKGGPKVAPVPVAAGDALACALDGAELRCSRIVGTGGVALNWP